MESSASESAAEEISPMAKELALINYQPLFKKEASRKVGCMEKAVCFTTMTFHVFGRLDESYPDPMNDLDE